MQPRQYKAISIDNIVEDRLITVCSMCTYIMRILPRFHHHDKQSSGSASLSSTGCNVALVLMRSRTSRGGPLDFDLDVGYEPLSYQKRSGGKTYGADLPFPCLSQNNVFLLFLRRNLYAINSQVIGILRNQNCDRTYGGFKSSINLALFGFFGR